MTAIDYDLEFLEDGRTIELISIGLVADNSDHYYAVNRDMPVRRIKKHKWLMENVVPGLPKGHGDARLSMSDRWLFHYGDRDVKPRKQIADEVRQFICSFPEPELWANYGAYDHVCLAQLWGRMIDLPDGIPMFTRDIQQEAARLGIGWGALPKQETGEHNALADARHNQAVRRWLAIQDELARFPARHILATGLSTSNGPHPWDECTSCHHDRDHHRDDQYDCEYEPEDGGRCDCTAFRAERDGG